MADKKDFSTVSAARLFGAAEQATNTQGRNPTASPAEQEARKEALQTQGRKGCKAIRINCAFTPSNHQFIKVLAKASGRTMTEFINLVVEAYRREHPELMEQANEFLETINSGAFSKLLDDKNETEDS